MERTECIINLRKRVIEHGEEGVQLRSKKRVIEHGEEGVQLEGRKRLIQGKR